MARRKAQFSHTVLHATVTRYDEATDTDLEVEVEFDYFPGTPDVMYMRNGDPGYPGDPEEVSVIEAKLPDGTLTELTEDEEQGLYETALELLGDAAEAAAEARYEARMDR